MSVVDYIICDQDTFQNVNYFVVKPPTYLTDHSQIVTWIDTPKLTKNNAEDQYQSEQTPLHKLLLQFEWSENSKNKFRQALKSPEIQKKLDHFIQSTFACDQNGVNECVTEFQSIITDASKKSLKLRKSKIRKRTTNILNKKWFDKECRFKRHELRKLANQKHRDPTNLAIREAYHTTLKHYKEILQTKKDKYQNDKLIELEKAAKNNPVSFWKTLRNISDDVENSSVPTYSPKAKNWSNHFSKLHSKHQLSKEHEQITENLRNIEKHKDQFNILDTEITESEILNTSTRLKLKKAVYSDRIKNGQGKYRHINQRIC